MSGRSASRLLPLAAAWAVFAAALGASAELIILDLDAPSDGKVTRDSETGLDWLDVRLTARRSYAEVVDEGAGGWIADGWRHATTEEVCDLFERHGLPPEPCPKPGNRSGNSTETQALHPFLGSVGGFLTGIFLDSDGGSMLGHARQIFFLIPPGIRASTAAVEENVVPRDESQSIGGHFLVRPVPEPGAAAGLAAVVLTLSGICANRAPRRDGPSP